VTPHREKNGRKRLSDLRPQERSPKLNLNIKLPNHLENHLPTFEALTPTVTLTATQTKRENRRGFQLKRQGKQQTATVAVTLVPGKI
jgi:hypothetical protein